MKINLAILASGRGSNFQSIINEINSGNCNANISLFITNNKKADAIKIAEANNIEVKIFEIANFSSREERDNKIKEELDKKKIDLVVLAGYMSILKSKEIFKDYKNKIINIHPSLLPSFPGKDAQKQAFEYGAKISGITIHFVDETLDGGSIIYQEAVDISECKNAGEVSNKILKIEHKAYPKIIDLFSKGKFIVKGRRVEYKKIDGSIE